MGQGENDVDFAKPSYFRIKFIFILVGRIISKMAAKAGTIGTNFFENEDIYRPHHDNPFSLSTLHDIDINDAWLEQNVAICYKPHVTIKLLRQSFDDRLINQNEAF